MEGPPLRILQILRAPVGGLFRHVSDLTEELGQRGHAVGIIVDSLVSDDLSQSRLDRLRPFASLGIHAMPMPRTLGWGDFTTPYRTRKLTRQLEIDVLHGHGAKGGLAARMGRTRRSVALNTPHGGVLNYRPGSLAGRFFRNAERSIGPLTDAYIFESAFAQRAFHEQIGRPFGREAVIHNGLRPAEFIPVVPDRDAKDFVFVGEFRDVKGIDVLFNAMPRLRGPDGRPVTIAMAGAGPALKEYMALAEQNGILAQIEYLGVRPARDAFRRGKCLVVPSRAESLPYVILEGASAGLPVISTRVGGIAEIYGPTATELIAAGDVEALARAMQAVLDNEAAARESAAVRLDFIRPRFSVSVMTDQIVALYRDILAARRSR